MITALLYGCGGKNIKAGDYVTFGAYEQDNNLSNGTEAIDWVVLEVSGDKALLLSKYVIDYREFHNTSSEFTWATSSIRKWLNSTFLANAFSNEESKAIITTNVEAHENPGTNPWGLKAEQGNSTQDKVFLLSIQETEKYFKNRSDRKAQITDYAKTLQSYVYLDNGNTYWWMRTNGFLQTNATFVDYDGSINNTGEGWLLSAPTFGVRPAIWVDVSALEK